MTAEPATIFALATGTARSAIAVIRITGPRAEAVTTALVGWVPQPRIATLAAIKDATGETLDRGLVLWFPAPHSVTGEPVAELHLHGGPAVLASVSEALLQAGATPAEPGAFTRRAFENGKLDLTQAEAVADLVDAETQAQRRQALRQLGGDLGAAYHELRGQLRDALAWIEAAVDFPDEGDVPGDVAGNAAPILDAVRAQLGRHLADAHRGDRIREGFRVAIIGAPNVGKSTLLNRLAGRDAAIVTDIPGTTRDVIEVRRVMAGHMVVFADTAGLRDTQDVVEREGVSRARREAQNADLRIGVVDASASPSLDALADLRDGDLLWVNKMDLAAARINIPFTTFHVEQLCGAALSGDGLAALETAIGDRVAECLRADDAVTLTRERHRIAVSAANQALEAAAAKLLTDPELAADDVRTAMRALERITGRIDVDDVLDRIFADFCIGK